MESIKNTIQYSNSNLTKLNNSNSTVQLSVKEVFGNITDLVKQDDEYLPFYISKYKLLGLKRFMYLANQARKGKTPARLFFWMLKNNELVK